MLPVGGHLHTGHMTQPANSQIDRCLPTYAQLCKLTRTLHAQLLPPIILVASSTNGPLLTLAALSAMRASLSSSEGGFCTVPAGCPPARASGEVEPCAGRPPIVSPRCGTDVQQYGAVAGQYSGYGSMVQLERQ